MIDPFVLLAPLLLLAVVALLQFVGCNWVYGIEQTTLFTPITFEQIVQNQSPNSVGDTTLSQTFNNNTTNGDLILVALKWGGNATPTVQDNNNKVYTPIGAPVPWSAGGGKRAQLFFGVADGSATTVTATLDQSSTFQIRICICEYAKVDTANPFDGSPVSNIGSGPSLSCGPLTTTSQDNMIWAVAFADDGHLALSQMSNFGLRAPAFATDNPYTLVEDLQAPNTGNYTADGQNTNTTPTINWVMLMVAIVNKS